MYKYNELQWMQYTITAANTTSGRLSTLIITHTACPRLLPTNLMSLDVNELVQREIIHVLVLHKQVCGTVASRKGGEELE